MLLTKIANSIPSQLIRELFSFSIPILVCLLLKNCIPSQLVCFPFVDYDDNAREFDSLAVLSEKFFHVGLVSVSLLSWEIVHFLLASSWFVSSCSIWILIE